MGRFHRAMRGVVRVSNRALDAAELLSASAACMPLSHSHAHNTQSPAQHTVVDVCSTHAQVCLLLWRPLCFSTAEA